MHCERKLKSKTGIVAFLRPPTTKHIMLGYNDLRDPSVSGFFRFLAKIGDGMMKMQIVKIRFGGKQ